MPVQLKRTIKQEYLLEMTDAKYGSEGDPTTVTIRQATQGAAESRDQLFSRVSREFTEEKFSVSQTISSEQVKRKEAYLTLCSSNLMDENGDALFKSDKDGNLDMTENEFKVAWSKLPSDIATEIHQKVIEVNISWSAEGEVA